MKENLAGLIKIVGISIILVLIWVFLSLKVPENFLGPGNIENLMRRTALYGILGIGVAFVIIGSGIDLSIGSLVCLCACLLGVFLHVDYAPLEQTDVWELNKKDKTMIASAGIDYQIGDFLWYDGERRDTGMIEVTSVDKIEREGVELFVLGLSKPPRKDRNSEDGTPIGSLSATYPLNKVQLEPPASNDPESETERWTGPVWFEARGANLAGAMGAKDKVKLVHPSKSKKERIVQSVSVASDDSVRVELTDPAKGIDNQYMMIPIARKPLMSIPLAISAVLAIALLIGVAHGMLVTQWQQRPFVVTLCGLMIYRGLARWITGGQTVGFIEYSDSLGWMASGRWVVYEWTKNVPSTTGGPGELVEMSFGIPFPVFFLVGIALLAIVFLNCSVWGRYIMAIGRNEEAARYAGINTKAMTVLTYVICAGLTGIGAILFAIDSNSIAPSSFGSFFELYAITAAVLGGCSLRGGEGSILGVIVGTALMMTLHNSIVLLKIPDELALVQIGLVLLLAVLSDEMFRHYAGRTRIMYTQSADVSDSLKLSSRGRFVWGQRLLNAGVIFAAAGLISFFVLMFLGSIGTTINPNLRTACNLLYPLGFLLSIVGFLFGRKPGIVKTVLLIAAMAIPLVGLFFMISRNEKSTDYLRQNGIKVGWLGARSG